MFLLPIGHEDIGVRRLPWVTIGIAAICTLVQVYSFVVEARVDEPMEQTIREMTVVLRAVAEECARKKEGCSFDESRGAQGLMDALRQRAIGDQLQQDRFLALDEQLQSLMANHPVRRFGFSPAHFSIIKMFTSIFTHGGWMHLIGNMLFLYLTGLTIEDRWGRARFLLFYLIGGIAAAASYGLVHRGSDMPLVGASGAIAAVMGAFVVLYAKTKIKFFYLWWFVVVRTGTFSAPAYLVLPFWFAQQLWSISAETAGTDNTGYSAHVGGFAFGAFVAVLIRVFGLDKRFREQTDIASGGWVQDPVLAEANALVDRGDHRAALVKVSQALAKGSTDPAMRELGYDLAGRAGNWRQMQRLAIPLFIEWAQMAPARVLEGYKRMAELAGEDALDEKMLDRVLDVAGATRNLETAQNVTRQLFRHHAKSPLVPKALFIMAEIQASQGRGDIQADLLERLMREHPGSPYSERARETRGHARVELTNRSCSSKHARMQSSLPESARVVISGGGIVGCSIAYHLAKLGWKDVVLLEQNKLAGGTTWHAAGMVGRIRTSNVATEIAEYSAKLYASLEEETGHATGWKQVGSLIVARSDERMTQLRRSAAIAEYFRVEVEMLDPARAKEKWPLIRIDDLKGALWIPGDGKVIPKETAISLAKGASMRGAQVIEDVRVERVILEQGRATGVVTNRGTIRAEHVVLAGGMWTRELGLSAGVNIPLCAVEHHYVVSNSIPGAYDELPSGRDPDGMIYFRGEGDKIMLGAFQVYTKPWLVERTPSDFSYRLLEPDWDAYQQPLKAGRWRIPALETSGFERFVNGPESFTPDNNFIFGEAPNVKSLWVAAGFNSVGIASGGGAGKLLAEWMAAGEPPVDLFAFDIRRFAPFQNNRAFLRDRVTEMLGLHYQMAWPNREVTTGRNLRKSPLHDRLAKKGACFGQKMGLERPLWFARPGMQAVMEYSFGKQNWFECHRDEHRAAREAVAVFDQTSFSKFVFRGRDVLAVLQRLCGNDVDVPIGRAVYTGMFNARGTFESDVTVIRTALDEYYVVSSTSQLVRDFDWISKNVGAGEQAALVDVSASYSVLGVMGPRSRELLSRISDTDLSNSAFPFGTSQMISIGASTVRAVRITYVGELGWELHCPSDQVQQVYDALFAAGADLGIKDAGHYAINSLRLEKGYRAWGAELSPDENPFEAGLTFAVAFDKKSGFLGRDALVRAKETAPKKRMMTFVCRDPEVILWGGERIFRDGVSCGYTSSASYGHTVGGAIAMGYVRGATEGRFAIELDGVQREVTAHLSPPYDPKRARILT